MLKQLPHPDIQHVAAARGWLELGNHVDAHSGRVKIKRVKVEGDTRTQTGIGNPYNEVWKRAK